MNFVNDLGWFKCWYLLTVLQEVIFISKIKNQYTLLQSNTQAEAVMSSFVYQSNKTDTIPINLYQKGKSS